MSRFWTLIVLGRDCRILCAVGEGGKVRNGGEGAGLVLDVNLGSKSSEAGVEIVFRMANASLDPCSEAVVKRV